MQLLVHTHEAEHHTKASGIHTLDNLILFDVGIPPYKIPALPVIFISSLITATVFTSQCKSSTILQSYNSTVLQIGNQSSEHGGKECFYFILFW
jgi:hypothetical protein